MKKKFTVTAVKSVDLVAEFTIEAKDETEAEELAESRVAEDDRSVPGSGLQWDDEGHYLLDISEIIPIDGDVI